MKKILFIIIFLFLIVSLIGCSKSPPTETDEINKTQDVDVIFPEINNITKKPIVLEHISNSINEETSEIYWNITKIGIDSNIKILYNEINDTTTRFCFYHMDVEKYIEDLKKESLDEKGIPIIVYDSEKSQLDKQNFDFSNIKNSELVCVSLKYDKLESGIGFKFGFESIQIIAASDAVAYTYSDTENIIQTSNNTLFIAFEGADSDLWWGKSNDDGATWETAEILAGTVSNVGIVVNNSDDIIVYYISGGDVDAVKSTDYGVAWSNAFTILDNGPTTMSKPSCTFDGNYILHCCMIGSDLTYINSTSWNSGATTITSDQGFCDIESDTNNIIYIIGIGGSTDDIEIWDSDGGWGAGNIIRAQNGNSVTNLQIAIDTSDRIYVVWEDYSDLFVANGSNGDMTSWTIKELDESSSLPTDVAADGDGNIYILYSSASQLNYGTFYYANSTNYGDDWTIRTELNTASKCGSIQHSIFPTTNRMSDMVKFTYLKSTSELLYDNITLPGGTSPPSNINTTIDAYNTTPDVPYTTDDLLFNITCSDANTGDTITGYVQLYNSTTENGSVQSAIVTNNTNTLIYTLDNSVTSYNDIWYGEYWCGDGTFNTTKHNDSVTIINTASTFDTSLIKQTVTVGNNLLYNINCSDVDEQTITYYDNSTLFNIDSSTGLINDTSVNGDEGVYNISIICSDSISNTTLSFIYTINTNVAISIDLVSPLVNSNVTNNSWNNFIFQVNCNGISDCTDINITFDPITASVLQFTNITSVSSVSITTPIPVRPQQLCRLENNHLWGTYGNNNDDIYTMNSSDNGTTWTNTLIVDGNGATVYGLKPIIDCKNDTIVVGWKDLVETQPAFNYSINDGMTWGGSTVAITTGSEAFLDIWMMPNNVTYMFVNQNTTTLEVYRTIDLSNWGTPTYVTFDRVAQNSGSDTFRAVVTGSGDNNDDVYVFSVDSTLSNISLRKSTDAGSSFSAESKIYTDIQQDQTDNLWAVGYNNDVCVISSDYGAAGKNYTAAAYCTNDGSNWDSVVYYHANEYNDEGCYKGVLDGRPSMDTGNGDIYYLMACLNTTTDGHNLRVMKYNGTEWNVTAINLTSYPSNKLYMPSPSRFLYNNQYMDLIISNDTSKTLYYMRSDVGSGGVAAEAEAEANVTNTTKGIMSTVVEQPFYTNKTSNPYTIANIGTGESVNVSFFYYPNGSGTYEFFAYVNSTSNMSVNNITEIINITIVTGATDTCSCPGLDTSWEIDMTDNCNITAACNLKDGNLTFVNTGTMYCNAMITVNPVNVVTILANQYLNVESSNCYINSTT